METPPEPRHIAYAMLAVLSTCGVAGLAFILRAPTDGPSPAMRVPHASTAEVDFRLEPFDQVCRTYVDEVGLVDYARLGPRDEALNAFLDQVAAVSPHSNIAVFNTEQEALAYWINAYNAWMMRAALDAYPIDSVMEVGKKKGALFEEQTRVCGGEELSLNQIEHEIVRNEFLEPRAHFALNCASGGCPWLPQEAFDPGRLEEQLDRETRRFFAEESHLRVEAEARTVYLSAILNWYGDDFLRWLREVRGVERPVVLDFVKLYAPPEVADALEHDFRVEYQQYDWGLNDVAGPVAATRGK